MNELKKRRSTKNNRRYKLHQKIKNDVCLKSRQRTILIYSDDIITNKYVLELLQKFKYNIQYTIKNE